MKKQAREQHVGIFDERLIKKGASPKDPLRQYDEYEYVFKFRNPKEIQDV